MLGAAFKPGTDDTRFSPAIELAQLLQTEGAEVVVHDPVVSAERILSLAPGVRVADDIVSGAEGWYAFEINETSEQTPWRPILWPFKMVVPLACLLLIIQGVSETIKSLHAASTGIVVGPKEKVEI